MRSAKDAYIREERFQVMLRSDLGASGSEQPFRNIKDIDAPK